MILVQNLQRLLNGNKLLLLFFCGLIICSSCDTLRVASKPKPTRKRVQHKKKAQTKVDTVQWIKDPRNKDKPISDDMPFDYGYNLNSEMKSNYNVVIMLPMRAEMNLSKTKWSKSSKRFINYYGGVQLALDDLKKNGVSLDVNVFDSEYSLSKVKSLWSNGIVNEADVVIGPYHKKALIYSAEKARMNEQILISPWISSPNIAKNNPFYIQTKSSLSQHYKSILINAYNNFNIDEIHILIKKGDLAKREEFEKIFSTISKNKELDSLNFIEVIPDTVEFGICVIDTLLIQDASRTAFILPYSSSKDEPFVYNFVRKYEILKKDNEVTLYGLYKWLEYSEEIYDYFNRMDIRLSVNGLVDPNNYKIINFKQRYYNRYGCFPTNDAYEGYDLIYYMGQRLNKLGDKFHVVEYMEEKIVGLQTAFEIKPVYSVEEESQRKTLEYYENGFIEIIGFEDFVFKIYPKIQ